MQQTIAIIEDAVRELLNGRIRLDRTLAEPTVDSEGDDALDVTLVLSDADLSGEDAIAILVRIQGALSAAGDERFPIVVFTTEEELALDDGAEA